MKINTFLKVTLFAFLCSILCVVASYNTTTYCYVHRLTNDAFFFFRASYGRHGKIREGIRRPWTKRKG